MLHKRRFDAELEIPQTPEHYDERKQITTWFVNAEWFHSR